MTMTDLLGSLQSKINLLQEAAEPDSPLLDFVDDLRHFTDELEWRLIIKPVIDQGSSAHASTSK